MQYLFKFVNVNTDSSSHGDTVIPDQIQDSDSKIGFIVKYMFAYRNHTYIGYSPQTFTRATLESKYKLKHKKKL